MYVITTPNGKPCERYVITRSNSTRTIEYRTDGDAKVTEQTAPDPVDSIEENVDMAGSSSCLQEAASPQPRPSSVTISHHLYCVYSIDSERYLREMYD